MRSLASFFGGAVFILVICYFWGRSYASPTADTMPQVAMDEKKEVFKTKGKPAGGNSGTTVIVIQKKEFDWTMGQVPVADAKKSVNPALRSTANPQVAQMKEFLAAQSECQLFLLELRGQTLKNQGKLMGWDAKKFLGQLQLSHKIRKEMFLDKGVPQKVLMEQMGPQFKELYDKFEVDLERREADRIKLGAEEIIPLFFAEKVATEKMAELGDWIVYRQWRGDTYTVEMLTKWHSQWDKQAKEARRLADNYLRVLENQQAVNNHAIDIVKDDINLLKK